jgi:hypothetical protein
MLQSLYTSRTVKQCTLTDQSSLFKLFNSSVKLCGTENKFKFTCKYRAPNDSSHRAYSSLLTVAVNLLARQRVAEAANTMLYRRTILKLPSHSILPKSPSRSKFVIPVINKQTNKQTNCSVSLQILAFRVEELSRPAGGYWFYRRTLCIHLQAFPVSMHFHPENGCSM